MARYFVLMLVFLSGCMLDINSIVSEENGSIDIMMCQVEDCEEVFIQNIFKAKKSIDCAFYDLELTNLISALNESKIVTRIVLDDHTYEDNYNLYVGMHDFVRGDKYSSLMHNKFCVIDGSKTITGSFNPTLRGRDSNDNNIVVLESKYISRNYAEEFEEIWKGLPKKTISVKNSVVIINKTRVDNYFCPDDCNEFIFTDLIDIANNSIYFMTFSFTKDEIGDALIVAHNRGVNVSGVFERSQNNKWLEYQRLKDAGLNVIWDSNKANMHHKVFIIDEKIVITGSTNPSNNGLTRNDENILIIHDENVAKKYVEEFERINII